MNLKEAFQILAQKKPTANLSHTFSIPKYIKHTPIEDYVEAYTMALFVLEKQIPIKPIPLPEKDTYFDGGYYNHKCPNLKCMTDVYDKQICCDKCGQVMDWGKNNE